MQTNRDGPQTLPHPMTRATDNHRTARGPPAPRVTLCPVGLPGPLALGSLTDPLEQPHAPSPAHPPRPRRAAASESGARRRGPGSSSSLPHTERVLRGLRTTRPQKCRPTPGQTHRAAAQAAAARTRGRQARTQRPNTQGRGRVPGGLPDRTGLGWGRTPGCCPRSPGLVAPSGQEARPLSGGGEGPGGVREGQATGSGSFRSLLFQKTVLT